MTKSFELKNFFSAQFELASNGQLDTWKNLTDANIFVTGGTGFFGKWILEIIQWANETHRANIQLLVLSRDPDKFKEENPRLANVKGFTFLKGDVTSFEFPKTKVTHILHAATSTSASLNSDSPLEMIDTIVQGTRRVLDFAHVTKAKKVLLTSSGGTYGPQPFDVSHFPEDYSGATDPLRTESAYGEGKRLAELLCAVSYQKYGIESVIARCFAFAGPYLAMDAHFAIGNFVRDALNGNQIHIAGDGTPHRSYLYGADMVQWLFTLLAFGRPIRAYHVGSEASLSIKEIAEQVAKTIGQMENRTIGVRIAKEFPGGSISRYVPSTNRARTEFGLRENFSLDDAIRLTANWKRRLS